MLRYWLTWKNEKKFKAEETREVEYVLIADEASKEDEAGVKENKWILSGSVVYNQETGKMILCQDLKLLKHNWICKLKFWRSYDSTYIAKKDLPAVDADQLFNLPQAKFMDHTFWKLLCRFKIDGQKIRVNANKSYLNQLWRNKSSK
jgi:peptidyl-prolyl cis-trans isomerase D